MTDLVTELFDEFHKWAVLERNGSKRTDGEEWDLELQMNFERVQALHLFNSTAPNCGEPPTPHAAQPAAKAIRADIQWSEPMCITDAGRRIWPSVNSKTAARKVPGEIDGNKLYTLRELYRRLGWSAAAFRSARLKGLTVRYMAGRGYVKGDDLISFVMANGKPTKF